MMSEQSQVLPEVHQTSWRTLPEHDVSREIIHSETVEENEESSCQDSGFDKTSDADTDSKVSLEASNVASSTENAAVTGGGDMGSGDRGDQDDGDDDTSLYVNPGDGGSRRASDLSTISGLNLDEFMIGSQPDTSDSCESPEKEMKDFDYSQVAREPAINDSLTDDGSGQPSFEQLVHKRNSAEIRNNIPELNQVKDCKFDDQGILDHLRTNKHGAIPKMKKQSPGVARRLPTHGSRVRDSSSSERDSLERDSILTEHPELVTRENGLAVDPSSVSNNVDRDDRYVCNGVPVAAVETTHSYVGARLAFGDDQVTKSPSHISMHGRPCLQQISAEEVEQTMTEIPLNDTVEDDRHALSTQTSEGESGDAESVVSDTAGGNGMPSVLDGLSDSREGSDIEEFLASPEGLKIQQQLEVESEQRRRHLVGERKEEVESALADIRSAIEKGKNTQLKCSQQESVNNEPVWVMRESYVERLQQQDILRQEREELEQAHEAECRRREMEKVREIEMEGDALLRGQQSRHHAGRVYRSPRGNDSDSDSNDEGHEHDQAIAGSWFRRKYAPVQTETDEQHEIRHKIHSSHKRSLANRHGQNAVNAGGQPRNSPSVNYDASVKSGYTPPGGVSHGPEEQGTHQSPSSRQTNGQSYHESGSECDSQKEDVAPTAYVERRKEGDYDTDEETDQLLDKQYRRDESVHIPELNEESAARAAQEKRTRAKEVAIYDPDEPSVLIEGVLFRARYLGSTQLVSEGQPSKALRMMQAQEAVGRIKAPEGESQPSTDVDLFVSTEKIMVLNTNLQEIMMDHALRTISYIADIQDIVVIMARRRTTTSTTESGTQKRQTKIICHVFETEEAQLVAQSIGQAFQVAYMEFLKANGIEDPGLLKEVNYEDVLNQQEIFGEELNLFANKEAEKEVIVPKTKGEPLGVVIVESGWGSMVPTVVLANMSPIGAAARCGQLNIGDQIISVNGVSLVGLPLSSCQAQIKTVKGQSVVKLNVVSCPPVVEVLVKRPDTKYQLGFSVQNGVICSLLRGGIAERGGVRVGHRIIEINGSSVVAVPHEKIVSMLANSVGEIHMKTMPTSIYRLLTGQEVPHYI